VALSQAEQRCLHRTCRWLSDELGGDWRLEDGPVLEDDPRYQGVSRPEARITDGARTAAVEVKALTGDLQFQRYGESLMSLKRTLRPSCGGYFFLCPWVDLRLPLGRQRIKELKREIERAAPGMTVGESRPIRVSRDAEVRIIDHNRDGPIYCSHAEPAFRRLQGQLHGAYWLIDDDQNEHRFVTDEARSDLIRSFSAAVRSNPLPRPGTTVPLHWYEEWELKRMEGSGLEDGVWITAVTDAADVPASTAEILGRMLEAGLDKFHRRWADFHVLALDKRWPLIGPEDVQFALGDFEPTELGTVNFVLLVEGDQVVGVRQVHEPQLEVSE
jgi:hypothetical protein